GKISVCLRSSFETVRLARFYILFCKSPHREGRTALCKVQPVRVPRVDGARAANNRVKPVRRSSRATKMLREDGIGHKIICALYCSYSTPKTTNRRNSEETRYIISNHCV
ncbi:MAG: hypothetical protein QGD88_12905, partial [Anaerolineae bacterium]|nr:hypothetical protein [Anaerolineae bacterium]